MPSSPIPNAAALSPTAVNIGITCSALNPKARSLLEASKTPGNSNGVLAANFSSSLKKLFAFSPSFKSVVKAIRVCSICPAAFTEARPKAPKATPTPAITPNAPLFMPKLSLAKVRLIFFCSAPISLLNSFIRAPITTCKRATSAIISPPYIDIDIYVNG